MGRQHSQLTSSTSLAKLSYCTLTERFSKAPAPRSARDDAVSHIPPNSVQGHVDVTCPSTALNPVTFEDRQRRRMDDVLTSIN